ncbi:MAG: hypothetical protein SV775_18710 [Thermodesulfobacteriota bacterium]|nr:hypothetical protein [Thermodesulfobacteriota bacterium]
MDMNPSLDISYVKNLIENREVNISRLGLFLKEELYNPDFETLLEEYLIRNNKAGNILVTARKLVGSQVR